MQQFHRSFTSMCKFINHLKLSQCKWSFQFQLLLHQHNHQPWRLGLGVLKGLSGRCQLLFIYSDGRNQRKFVYFLVQYWYWSKSLARDFNERRRGRYCARQGRSAQLSCQRNRIPKVLLEKIAHHIVDSEIFQKSRRHSLLHRRSV